MSASMLASMGRCSAAGYRVAVVALAELKASTMTEMKRELMTQTLKNTNE
jgi:hypothetical protein